MSFINIGQMKAEAIARQFGANLEKAQGIEIEKARQVGDMHPNGKWVWTEYKPGRFDWRPVKGRGGVDRTPQGKKEGEKPEGKKEPSASGETVDVSKFMDAVKTFSNKYNDESKITVSKTPKGNWNVHYDGKRLGIINSDVLSEQAAKAKGWIEGSDKQPKKTVDDHAKQTDTKTLQNAAKSDKAPGSVKGAAQAELDARSDNELKKKLDFHSQNTQLTDALFKIAKDYKTSSDADKSQYKAIINRAIDDVVRLVKQGDLSGMGDDALAQLSDLSNMRKYMKEADSEPQQIGDVIQTALNDLKRVGTPQALNGKTQKDGQLHPDYYTDASGKEKIGLYRDGKLEKQTDDSGNDFTIATAQKYADSQSQKKEKPVKFGETEYKRHYDEDTKETWYEGQMDGHRVRILQEKVGKNDWWNVEVDGEFVLDSDGAAEVFTTPSDAHYEAEVYADKASDKNRVKFATKAMQNILDPLDEWEEDDWFVDGAIDKINTQLSDVVKKYDLSKEEFDKIAKKYQGLDLWYPDYAPRDKVLPIATKEIQSELEKFDDFSEDDWQDSIKQDKIINAIKGMVAVYHITKDEWKEIAKPYAEGLSGLPYEDFK